DRLARRLDAGEHIEPLQSYCFGIARLLLFEVQRTKQHHATALDQLTRARIASNTGEAVTHDLLETCLDRLPAESRRLVLDYYQGEKRGLIERRKALADRLGIPINALRLRASRIRLQLEKCVEKSLREIHLGKRSHEHE